MSGKAYGVIGIKERLREPKEVVEDGGNILLEVDVWGEAFSGRRGVLRTYWRKSVLFMMFCRWVKVVGEASAKIRGAWYPKDRGH